MSPFVRRWPVVCAHLRRSTAAVFAAVLLKQMWIKILAPVTAVAKLSLPSAELRLPPVFRAARRVTRPSKLL